MNLQIEKIKKLLIGINNINCFDTINLIKLKKSYYENLESYINEHMLYANIGGGDHEMYNNNPLDYLFPLYDDNVLNYIYQFLINYIDKDGFIIYDKNDLNYMFSDNVIYIDDIKYLRNYKFTIKNYNFYFDISGINNMYINDYDNNYNYNIKTYKDCDIFITVSKSKNIQDINEIMTSLLYIIPDIDININDIKFMINTIEKNNPVEIYVCKNVKPYLEKKFFEWIYLTFFKSKFVDNKNKLLDINNIINCGIKIIEYINEFESNLYKTLSNNKKIKSSNYVITLDKINDINIIKKIVNHNNIDIQIKEWIDFEIVDSSFKIINVIDNTLWGEELNNNYKYLPIDLKYFTDISNEIINSITNIDEKLDGILINANNYFGLNLLLENFKEKIQCIYIDPPFNLSSDSSYRLYKTRYDNFKWIKLLYERVLLGKELLKESGSFYMRCDNNGNYLGNMLLNNILDFKNNIIFKKEFYNDGRLNRYSVENEYLLFYVKNKKNNLFNPIKLKKNRELGWNRMFKEKANFYQDKHFSKIRYVNNIKIEINKSGHWTKSQEETDKLYEEKKLIAIDKDLNIISRLSEDEIKKANITIKPNVIYTKEGEYYYATNLWTDIYGYIGKDNSKVIDNIVFGTENSEKLLKRVILSSTNEGDYVLDYFLGSGTTAVTAHKSKRKWIGIEKNHQFYDVVMPKLKKILAYSDNSISKDDDVKLNYNKNNAGGIFKYIIMDNCDLFSF